MTLPVKAAPWENKATRAVAKWALRGRRSDQYLMESDPWTITHGGKIQASSRGGGHGEAHAGEGDARKKKKEQARRPTSQRPSAKRREPVRLSGLSPTPSSLATRSEMDGCDLATHHATGKTNGSLRAVGF